MVAAKRPFARRHRDGFMSGGGVNQERRDEGVSGAFGFGVESRRKGVPGGVTVIEVGVKNWRKGVPGGEGEIVTEVGVENWRNGVPGGVKVIAVIAVS